ncbi:hypothetical protein E2562_013360 [Oryza meyeriana var. granulata]|uniref:Uncharacterized protein n=1 Tax=Oryza meyeriana var. granulata TaxID=110450 RepID=A0A6G1CES3_9ORYZ|nr:hypothetical protein E2562_013360 [Oryza meyeriana var. granulata]
MPMRHDERAASAWRATASHPCFHRPQAPPPADLGLRKLGACGVYWRWVGLPRRAVRRDGRADEHLATAASLFGSSSIMECVMEKGEPASVSSANLCSLPWWGKPDLAPNWLEMAGSGFSGSGGERVGPKDGHEGYGGGDHWTSRWRGRGGHESDTIRRPSCYSRRLDGPDVSGEER